MNGYQLRSIIDRFPQAQKNLEGVYPRDQLPHRVDRQKARQCFIINTHPAHKSGEHWVVVCFQHSKAFYFDSFGFPPMHGDIQSFIRRNSSHFVYNAKPVQAVSNFTCGLYAIYVIVKFSQGVSPTQILHPFRSRDFSTNDNKLVAYFQRRLSGLVTPEQKR